MSQAKAMDSLHEPVGEDGPFSSGHEYAKRSIAKHIADYLPVSNEDPDNYKAELDAHGVSEAPNLVSLRWIYLLSIASFGIGLSWSL